MTTTPATRPKLVAPDGETPPPVLNLHQRLLAIQGEVDHIKATGKTAFSQNEKAISIEDVEDALGDLFQKHRVLSGYRFNDKPTVAGAEGRTSLWLVDLTIWLANPDDPKNDRIDDRACDVGTSPSAAVSYTVKRYYKALFHLAGEEDEKRSTPPPQRATPPAQRDVAAPPVTPTVPLTEQQKQLLINLGKTLTHPWDKDRYAQEIGKRGFLGTREFLLSAHRTQHGEGCPHFAEAVAALGDEEKK